MHDLGDLPSGFPVIVGSTGPSHGFVHAREVGTPVEIFGMTVDQGDLVHADRHEALIVPPDVILLLKTAIERLIATEQFILEPAR